jgi:hypothetical protein
MRDDCYGLAVEKVQHPVILTAKTDSQLVDTIPEKIGFGTPQFVTYRSSRTRHLSCTFSGKPSNQSRNETAPSSSRNSTNCVGGIA